MKEPTSTTTTATMTATTTTTTLGPESGAMMTETTADNCDLTPVPMEIEESTVGLSGDFSPEAAITTTMSAATPEVVSTAKITTTSELQFDSNDDISAEERRMRKQYWLGPDVTPTDAVAAAASSSAATAVTPIATENLGAAATVEETAKTNAAVASGATAAAIKVSEESTATTAATVIAPPCVTAALTVPCGEMPPATSTTTESDAPRNDEGCSRLSTSAASPSEVMPLSGSADDPSNPVPADVTVDDTSAVVTLAAATATAPSENYDHFNYWYIPPPVLDDHLLPTLALGPFSSSSAAAGSSTDVKTATDGDLVGRVSKGMEALEIGEKTREEQELEISQSFEVRAVVPRGPFWGGRLFLFCTVLGSHLSFCLVFFQIPPLAMSSPDKEACVDSRPSAEGASGSKNDVDVEMAEDDPVTDLFGGESGGTP